ncbi:hypothetical protein PSEUDO8AS_40574 [Pseudomonas sp. 8AS]|nr:hypothetical protein PSEUDO8AS_40574 [Pseudomonas sp. 8AS]
MLVVLSPPDGRVSRTAADIEIERATPFIHEWNGRVTVVAAGYCEAYKHRRKYEKQKTDRVYLCALHGFRYPFC